MGFALVPVLAMAAFGVVTYNMLARLRLLASNAWADIDVQLKRRHDLVPMLVSVVKGHASFEKGTFEAVANARNQALAAGGPAQAGEAEQHLAGSVRQLFALAEAYPELRTGESYLSLQRNLTEIENQLQDARRYYNAVVRDLNTAIARFPANLIAGPMGFTPREFFGLGDPSESAPPTVDTGSAT